MNDFKLSIHPHVQGWLKTADMRDFFIFSSGIQFMKNAINAKKELRYGRSLYHYVSLPVFKKQLNFRFNENRKLLEITFGQCFGK